MLVILPQEGQAVRWRQQPHRTRFCQLIVGRTRRVEPLLEPHHPLQQRQIPIRRGLDRGFVHAPQVIVVPGIAGGESPVGTEGLLVQDGHLFPKGTLRSHGEDRCCGMLEHLGILLGGVAGDFHLFCGRPGRQCADLQPNHR